MQNLNNDVLALLKPPTQFQMELEFQTLTKKKKDKQVQLSKLQKENRDLEWTKWRLDCNISEVEGELTNLETRSKELLKLLQPMEEYGAPMDLDAQAQGVRRGPCDAQTGGRQKNPWYRRGRALQASSGKLERHNLP